MEFPSYLGLFSSPIICFTTCRIWNVLISSTMPKLIASFSFNNSCYRISVWKACEWLEIQNKSLVFVIAHLSFNSTRLTLVYIFLAHTCLSLYAWYSFICLHLFEPRKQLITSTLIKDESWGQVLEPFTGNSISLLSYHLCVKF